MVHDFAKNEVELTAEVCDEEDWFDGEIFKKMGELGLTRIPCQKRWGIRAGQAPQK